jgi:hypothetical protein
MAYKETWTLSPGRVPDLSLLEMAGIAGPAAS